MQEREYPFDEPIIFCSHNFDISDVNSFAKELSLRFGVNINITTDGDTIIDSIKIPNATITKNLYCQNSKFEYDFSYVLEYGDEAHLFYENHLEYWLPFSLDFLDFSNPNDIYDGIKELQKFGANTVYIGNLNKLNLSNKMKYDWDNLMKTISDNVHYKIDLI